MTQGEDEVLRIWNDYFEDLYNIKIQEHIAVHMCSLMGFREVTTSEKSQLEGESREAQKWKYRR